MGYKQEVSKDTLLIREAHIFFILCWLLCSFKLNEHFCGSHLHTVVVSNEVALLRYFT